MTDPQAAEMARRRLDRLARLSAQYGAELNERGVKLLRHAAFACYLDLKDLEDERTEAEGG